VKHRCVEQRLPEAVLKLRHCVVRWFGTIRCAVLFQLLQRPGTLPPSWGALTKLRVCWLGINTLSGPLPGSWSGMAALEDLKLNGNSLTGGTTGRWWSMAGGLYVEQVIRTLRVEQRQLLGQQQLEGKPKGQSIHAGVAGR
jgi:hypothetical protein